ncbi:MAG: LamG-like jellyroll fold domain-containing protein [Janthinobacterium lividum]
MRTSLHKTLLLAGLLAAPAGGAWAIGNSLNFNAANSSYVQVARPASVSDDFTIEFWVKTTMAGPTGTNWYDGAGLVDGEIGGVTNDFGISLLNRRVAFGVGGPDVTIQSTTSINDDKWHHIAATRVRSSGLMLLYIDGVQEASSTGKTTSTNSQTAATNLRLGSIQTGLPAGTAFFTGQLDEVRMWSTVRTQAQLAANMNYLLPAGTANLAAYYRLDEGTGTTTSGTGTGAAGTLTNSPTWVVPSTAPLYGVPVISSFAPMSAVTGASVVIQGSNFTGATSVQFNGVAASFTVSSNGQQITATVPSGATSGQIKVVGPVANATGTATSTGTFTVLPHLTGTVFDDVNYGGGAGRSLATAQGSASNFTNLGRPGATVELYLNGMLQGTATTDANGVYSFYNLSTGTYTVRVVSSTVTAARTGSTAGLLPVVTYQNGTTDQVGGPSPALPDAAANAGTSLAALSTSTQAAEALSTAAVSSSASTSGVDFGFNFDLVVNANATGQGSLAQFITNSNALGNEAKLAQAGSYLSEIVGTNATGTALPAGTETSIFMVPDGAAHDGLRAANASPAGPGSLLTAGVVVISPTTAAGLPAVSGPSTVINGWTQTYNIGNTNSRTVGNGGPVGVNNVVLPQLNAPEVQLTGTATTNVGLDLTGANTGVMGLAVYGFGNGGDTNTYANIRTSGANVTVLGNLIGSTAGIFALPGSGAGKSDGIRATGGAGLIVRNNLIGYNGGKGIAVGSGVTGTNISQNEIRSNASGNATWDGVDMQGSASTILNNLVINNAGVGLDGYNSAGSNSWTGNTISGNGAGTSAGVGETPGVRVFGPGNTISQNLIFNNYGAGIMLTPGATTTVISQNAVYGNGSVAAANNGAASGQLGIDLEATGQDISLGTNPFVTLNSTTTTGANSLLNYPILQTASLQGTTLTVRGLVTSGRRVELFLATPNTVTSPATGNNFGQGSSYLGPLDVTRTDSTTNYGAGNINGFAQGSNSGVPFSARLSLTSLTAAQRDILAAGDARLTSTATAAGIGTSEFSGIVVVSTAPTAYDVVNQKIAAGTSTNNPAVALNPGLTTPQAANDPASTIASFTVRPVSNGTLYYNGTAIAAAFEVPAADTNLLTFTPTVGFTGNASFTFSVKNAKGTVSNLATYTIPVVASNSFVANDDGLDAKQNTATSGNVVLNDLNPTNTTSFTVTRVNGPTNGTLTLAANGSYTYTPTSGYLGPDSFVYKVCSGTSTTDCSNTATVSINVYNPATVCSSATGPNLLMNPGFEAGNDGSFTSAYTFVPRLKTNNSPNSSGLVPETTYAVDTDAHYYHSGFTGLGRGGSGSFMIVNGAANQSKVYSQVVTVVPDRYYTFSGWAQSVNTNSPAVLGFVINGKSASVSTTLTTAPNDYTQFSGVWYSGTSRTATFEVRDINRDSGGNDFGLDDVYFGTCSVNLQAVTKTQSPAVPYQGAPTNLNPLEATLTSTGASVASFVVQTVPTDGMLRLGGPDGTLVVPGQVIPYAQRGAIYYLANGSANTTSTTFTYTAVDSEGAGSNNIATYTIPVVASPLPVVLTAFTARASGGSALLDWATASEKNNASFAVERSRTGRPVDFVAIGQLAGQGTSTAAHTYRFTDPNAAAMGAVVYYRLRQVDVDGTSTYSPVRAVSFGDASAAANVALFPNPVAGLSTSLDLSQLPATATYQVRLLDATGRASRQWALPGGQTQPLDLGSLAPGTYLLLVSGQRADGSALRQVLHLTKE